MHETRQVRLLFVPGKVLDYSEKAAPGVLPVWFREHEVTMAVYDDYHYGFNLPARLVEAVETGAAQFRFVYQTPLKGESYEPQSGSRLARIQIEKVERPAPAREDPNNILEL